MRARVRGLRVPDNRFSRAVISLRLSPACDISTNCVNMGLYRRLSSRFGSKKNGSQGGKQASVNGTSSLGTVEEHTTPPPKATQASATSPATTNGTSQARGTQASKPSPPLMNSGPQANGTEASGTSSPATNGASIGQSLDQTKHVDRDHSSYASKPQPAPPQRQESKGTPAATRKDVEDTFEEFAQLIHASRRPMPTQMGDGSYLEKDEPSGWFQDLKSLKVRDVETAKEIMDDKRSGKPQDDRKMHMEHIMQVSFTAGTMITSDRLPSSLRLFPPNLRIANISQIYSLMNFGNRSSILRRATWDLTSVIALGTAPTTAISSQS